MLVGALKLGAWVIFDEVNRIEPQVLSVISEYVSKKAMSKLQTHYSSKNLIVVVFF